MLKVIGFAQLMLIRVLVTVVMILIASCTTELAIQAITYIWKWNPKI